MLTSEFENEIVKVKLKKNGLDIQWAGSPSPLFCANSFDGFWKNSFYGRTDAGATTAVLLCNRTSKANNLIVTGIWDLVWVKQ